VRTHEFLSTTDTTWCETLGVGAILFPGPSGTFQADGEVENGSVTDRLDSDWLGLVFAGSVGPESGESRDDHEKDDNHRERITTGTIKGKHL
jgi:hypothetical protein